MNRASILMLGLAGLALSGMGAGSVLAQDAASALAAAPAPAPPPPPPPPRPQPPSMDLKLVRVGAALDGRVFQFFDETSIKRDGNKATVWRLYVLGAPRPVGRIMSQAIWNLAEFDCEAEVVEDKASVLLGMGLDIVGRARPNAGSSLYSGALADATTARQACGGDAAPGPRYDSVSMAVRKARQGKD